MKQPHIVFAEDDLNLAQLIQTFLERNELRVTLVHDGKEVIKTVEREQPGLVLLDIMLPNLDGLSICQQLRTLYTKPIVLFTANDSEVKHILGLDLGANDYIIKTTPPNILLARIRAQLRQHELNSGQGAAPANVKSTATKLTIGALSVDPTNRSVDLMGTHITLSSMEFDLLWLLASNAGLILSRDDLLKSLRSIDYDGLDRSIDINISRLRKKLGDDATEHRRIITVRNKGYLLSPHAWDA
jgi:two-component system response regulator RstA